MPNGFFPNQVGGYSLKGSGGTINNPQKSDVGAGCGLFFSKKPKVSLAFDHAVCIKTTLPIEHEDFCNENRYSPKL